MGCGLWLEGFLAIKAFLENRLDVFYQHYVLEVCSSYYYFFSIVT